MKKIIVVFGCLIANVVMLNAAKAGGGAASTATGARADQGIQVDRITGLSASTNQVGILNRAAQFMPQPSAFVQGVSSVKHSSLKTLAEEYWHYLKTGKGDPRLYYLISEETIAYGYQPFGLTAQDIEDIEMFVRRFLIGRVVSAEEIRSAKTDQEKLELRRRNVMSSRVEKFAFPRLPYWLAALYENKTSELIKNVLQDPKTSKYYEDCSFLGPQEIRQGVAEFVVQNAYQQRDGHPVYVYFKKDMNTDPIVDRYQAEIRHIILDNQLQYVYIRDVDNDLIADSFIRSNPGIGFIIVRSGEVDTEDVAQRLTALLQVRKGLRVIVVFDDTVQRIPNTFGVFSSIQDLVVIGAGLTQVGHSFLFACHGLTSLRLPAGLMQVGDSFLYGCQGLTSLRLPVGLTRVEDRFLVGCKGLTSLRLPAGLRQVGDYFLFGCSGLTSLRLPVGLRQVRDGFLAGCSGLTSLRLPVGLTQVGRNFLYGCKGLTSLRLPVGLRQVGDYFLRDCSGLESLVLPVDLTQVGRNFLAGCPNLKRITLTRPLYEQVKDQPTFPKNVEIEFHPDDVTQTQGDSRAGGGAVAA